MTKVYFSLLKMIEFYLNESSGNLWLWYTTISQQLANLSRSFHYFKIMFLLKSMAVWKLYSKASKPRVYIHTHFTFQNSEQISIVYNKSFQVGQGVEIIKNTKIQGTISIYNQTMCNSYSTKKPTLLLLNFKLSSSIVFVPSCLQLT